MATALAVTESPTNLLAPGPHEPTLQWFCPPPTTDRSRQGEIKVITAPKTDFWQRTHYGFKPDNGHFLHTELTGDFVIATTISSHPNGRFDQAGLMVRLSPSCWLKTSVEYQPDGRPSQLGVVVTNAGYSDWSTVNFPAGVQKLSLRVRREGSDYLVEATLPPDSSSATPAIDAGGEVEAASGWTQLRMAHLLEDTAPTGAAAGAAGGGGECSVAAGLYCCSPLGPGFEVTFHHLTVFAGRVATHE